MASKIQRNQRFACGDLNNTLCLSHFSFNMNYEAKYLMAVASFTKLLQESYFFLQLLYPCFVLSKRSFLILYGSLLRNNSFWLFSLLFAQEYYFMENTLSKLHCFVIDENWPWLFWWDIWSSGINIFLKNNSVVVIVILTIFFLASFRVILPFFFQNYQELFLIMTSRIKIILIFYCFRRTLIISTANTS